jgi:hypothetical protein
MIDPEALGVTYTSPEHMMFIVVEKTPIGVVVLVLQDNPESTKPIYNGVLMNIFSGSAFYNESIPFASSENEVE